MFEDDEVPNFCLDLGLQDIQDSPPAKKQWFERSATGPTAGRVTAKSTKYATAYVVTVFKGEKHFLPCKYNSS